MSLTAWVFGSMYVVYTFIGPFLEQRYGLGRDGISGLLALFGLSAVVGNWIGGLLTDRIGPERTTMAVCAGLVILTPPITALTLPMVAFAALSSLWAMVAFAFMSAQQARLVGLDPARASTLLALNAASIYLGGALGAYAGGETLKAQGFSWLGPVGALFAVVGLASIVLTNSLRPRVQSNSEETLSSL